MPVVLNNARVVVGGHEPVVLSQAIQCTTRETRRQSLLSPIGSDARLHLRLAVLL